MRVSIRDRVKKYRDNMRNLGLRPVQIWVPDTRKENFSQECQRQSRLIAQSEMEEVLVFMDDALGDVDGWTN